ncbi:MAG: M20 family metallopeptidase [Burkholderiales bacterium]|nr:M20 family metallopeptidase [Burkholderiales bacterium]
MPTAAPSADALAAFVERKWDAEIVSQLVEYVRTPAKSPHFDRDWAAHGHLEAVVRQAEAWCRAQPIADMALEVVRLPGRTPLLFFELPGIGRHTVLLYGHLDKQPEMTGWRAGLGPWQPVIQDGRLYGRGGADDGYAVFASLTAIAALRAQNVPHARCVGLIECCEESGSYDLPAYLEALAPRLGAVDFVVGLDSGCGNYDQLWVTTSLRGIAAGTLAVDVLAEGVHSGDASGIVPSSFRVARVLLDRLEDPRTGAVLPRELHCEIPAERVAQARAAGAILGEMTWKKFPYAGGTRPLTPDPGEAVLNRTWRPALSVTGADGLPPIADAGNVLRPRTALKLSMRIPPRVDGTQATRDIKRILEADPPHGAQVRFAADQGATGWDAPPTAPWLAAALEAASQRRYGRPAAFMGEGGTIPFMGMLGRQFPAAQFLITGVLGPQSNAHGPNEFLHIPYAKKLTACVADVIAAHAARAA